MTPQEQAARVVAAFDAVMGIDDSTGLFEDSRHALAAALRELAAVSEISIFRHFHTAWSDGYRQSTLDTIAGVHAIAKSIDNATTEPPTND